MAEAKPKKRSVNYDLIRIISNYFKESSRNEIRFDLIVPFIISCILSIFFIKTDFNLINIFNEINGIIISVMSILAGFNTASIAIIAASNPLEFVNSVDEKKKEGQRLLNGLTSYFSYAIVLQLFILILSIVASIALKFLSTEMFLEYKYLLISLVIAFILWFTLVLNSLFITLRNASILHNFILYIAKKNW